MVKLSEKHEFVLYSLLRYLKEVNRRFENEPLETSISKIGFIKLLLKLGVVEKSERALYKNLEILEKERLIKYDNKFLKLSKRGLKLGMKKEKGIYPYLKLHEEFCEKKNIRSERAIQAYFK